MEGFQVKKAKKKKLEESIIEKYRLLKRSFSQSDAFLQTGIGDDGNKAVDIDRLIYDLDYNISLMEEIKNDLERIYGSILPEREEKFDNFVKFSRKW